MLLDRYARLGERIHQVIALQLGPFTVLGQNRWHLVASIPSLARAHGDSSWRRYTPSYSTNQKEFNLQNVRTIWRKSGANWIFYKRDISKLAAAVGRCIRWRRKNLEPLNDARA